MIYLLLFPAIFFVIIMESIDKEKMRIKTNIKAKKLFGSNSNFSFLLMSSTNRMNKPCVKNIPKLQSAIFERKVMFLFSNLLRKITKNNEKHNFCNNIKSIPPYSKAFL